jgi:hypothetical protein
VVEVVDLIVQVLLLEGDVLLVLIKIGEEINKKSGIAILKT